MEQEAIHTEAGNPFLSHPGKRNFLSSFSEDLWAICIGGLLIVIVLTVSFLIPDFKFTTPSYQWTNGKDLFTKVFGGDNLLLLAGAGFLFLLLSSATVTASGNSVRKYVSGFGVIYLLAILSLIIAGNHTISYYGIEYVVFALIIGLIPGNFFHLPSWIKEAARSEFFIKTGLIILGTTILFTDIVKAGIPGILQSVLVVAAVWVFAMWICRRLKVDDEFGVILASAVSICGVSAAIVACGAINGDKKKLSYVTTLVLLVAVPMMILLPWMIHKLNISELVGGAWVGGTIDTTASVAAASELVSPAATKAAVIVKFSQNVLIGVAAFFIAGWWVFRKTATANREKPSFKMIWERFPKFVIGFISASLIFSFLIPSHSEAQVSGILNSLRTVWFALAFVSIGMEARFSDLLKTEQGRPALAFIGAQLFNIIWTLLWAYLLFGGILIPAPDIR